MIYRGPGFIAMNWPLPHPPYSPSTVSNLSLFLSLPLGRRSSLLTGGGGGEGAGHEQNHSNARMPGLL
jgi:hypothetical protein